MEVKDFLKEVCGYTDRDLEYNTKIALSQAIKYMDAFSNYKLRLNGVGSNEVAFKDKEAPTFEEWISTFKKVNGELYQYDNYRTYCHAAMLEQYRFLYNVNP